MIENISEKPQDEYFLPFTKEEAEKLGVLEARDKKDASLQPFQVEVAATEGTRYAALLRNCMDES